MPQQLHFTKFAVISLIISLAFHAMLIAAVLFLPTKPPEQVVFPVNIVDLPPDILKKIPLPPKPSAPAVPKRMLPEKPLPPGGVPKPEKFGKDDTVTLPKTMPRQSSPKADEQGKENEKTTPETPPKHTGPLPFLSQNDIDQLARKGMPQKKPGDESVTLDTDEFKFISYNRWLKIKVESVLKYPELAAISGYQGALFIKFDIMKDGSVSGVEVLKSSGYKILDDEALRSIRAAAPFQPLPNDWNMERYSIRAAVLFYLGEGYIR